NRARCAFVHWARTATILAVKPGWAPWSVRRRQRNFVGLADSWGKGEPQSNRRGVRRDTGPTLWSRPRSVSFESAPTRGSPRSARKSSLAHSRTPLPSITPWNARNTSVVLSPLATSTSHVGPVYGSRRFHRNGDSSNLGLRRGPTSRTGGAR